VVVSEPCPAIFRRTWRGTPASAIQVSPVCRRSCRRRCSYPWAVTTSSQCVPSRRTAVLIRPPAARRTDGCPATSPGRAERDQLADLDDQRYRAGALALGALIGQPTGAGRGLPPQGPRPRLPVDVAGADPGHLADPGGSARGDDGSAPKGLAVIASLLRALSTHFPCSFRTVNPTRRSDAAEVNVSALDQAGTDTIGQAIRSDQPRQARQ
jgi:hypothetical protein